MISYRLVNNYQLNIFASSRSSVLRQSQTVGCCRTQALLMLAVLFPMTMSVALK